MLNCLRLLRVPRVAPLWTLAAALSASLAAQTNVLTYHNDVARTGQNLAETQLTPASVNATTFGRRFNLLVDGKVDAQPLYVANLRVAGSGLHNTVFVATEHDSVYAFDTETGATVWQVSLLKAGETTSDARNCSQVVPEIGITATPVIDLAAGPHGAIYVVAMSKDASGNYYQRLHSLDLTTGAEQFNGPVDIAATYPGTGANSSNGTVVFDPKQYKSRPGLLLVNGIVYTSWSSHCDIGPYTGWTIGYNQLTLAQASVFNFAPNGGDASIWSSGAGPAADASGDLYFQIANGTFDTVLDAQGFPSHGDYGNAFLRLRPAASGLNPVDYWTMFDTVAQSRVDEDLGSGGTLLLPDLTDSTGAVRHLGTGAGKDRNVYVYDRDNLGKFNPGNNSNIYQEIAGGLAGPEFGMPAWFNGTLYYGASGDAIRAFTVTNARLMDPPGSLTSMKFQYPGATPSISANGTQNGIVWAAENSNPAVLHAFDAGNLNAELYNSNQAPSGRDQFGAGNKYIVPTVADGKVFVASQNSVAIFGLLQQIVVNQPTVTRLTASALAAVSGTAVTFSATVASSGEGHVPAGSIVFSDGGAPLATVPVDVSGSAQFSSSLAVGEHAVTALFQGGTGFARSVSPAVDVIIAPVPSAQTSFVVAPVQVPPAATLGAATLTWSTAATVVEVHVGTPSGPLFTRGGAAGSITTGNWVTDGMPFFLQDVSNANPLTAAGTLALSFAKFQATPLQGSLLATPNPVPVASGQIYGAATLQWDAKAGSLELHVGAPNGPLFAAGGSQGQAATGQWITDGAVFFLQDVSSGRPLTSEYTVAAQTIHLWNSQSGISFQASPNPVIVPAGSWLGTTTLYWNAPGTSVIELHLGSPAGPLFARGGSEGSAATANWVTNGLTFYLQDVTGGKALTGQNTLATLPVSVMPASPFD